MVDALLRMFVQMLLWLRYNLRLRGSEEVARRGARGILFLPNHPALIDPVIVLAALHRRFAPRPLADARQVDRFFVRWLARRIGVRPLADIRVDGPAAREQVAGTIQDCMAGLRRGENLLLYPAGHLAQSRYEDLAGNSAVERILREVPDARVVLVRTRGLWGSSFSLAHGHVPSVAEVLKRGVAALLGNLLLFMPRRAVTIELHEPADLPRCADRGTLNEYLERFYNSDAPPAVHVPYFRWERGGQRELPEPSFSGLAGAAESVPETTRKLVFEYLRTATGAETMRDTDRLAQDLGLDSLAKSELVLWLGKEFGYAESDVDALQTVGDVLLAARGEAAISRPESIRPPARRWFRAAGAHGVIRRPRGVDATGRIELPAGETLEELFVAQVRRGAGRAVIADQIAGVKSYRDMVTVIHAVRRTIAAWPEERVGILLPASVGAAMTYFAVLFAGKVPVMVNWTTGARNLRHALEMLGVRHVLTVRPLVTRIESQGMDLGGIAERFVYLEDVRAGLSRAAKLRAALRAWLTPGRLKPAAHSLTQSPAERPAVILLTSGSETLPKAVPLTHANLLANIRDVLRIIKVYESDCLIGFLPPFHSFGLTVTLLLPVLAGARAVYHANPTEAWVLARLIAAYGATLLCGTPTFLSGILRAARDGELDTLRIAVTGAEKCPERTYEALQRCAPNATIIEGYGVTECAPIISATREEDACIGTIGRVLPSLEYAVVGPETMQPAPRGTSGLLLVRGPSVFPGYIGDAPSPFVEYAGKQWYRTGDLVCEDERGVLTFRGRLKRFVKLGGEMISLPAIEAVLERQQARGDDEGPAVAVVATADEHHPELVLFTTRELDRSTANRWIREAGLSALHNVSRVIRVDEIPVLGTGKTDYRALGLELERSKNP